MLIERDSGSMKTLSAGNEHPCITCKSTCDRLESERLALDVTCAPDSLLISLRCMQFGCQHSEKPQSPSISSSADKKLDSA